MERFPVFTPNPDSPSAERIAVAGIDPKSAIVGAPDAPENVDPTLIYYEGNRYRYAGVETFADRARVAAGRLAERYPTIARATVPRTTLTQVGWFTPGHGVDVIDAHALVALAKWLDLFDGERFDPDALFGELRLTQ